MIVYHGSNSNFKTLRISKSLVNCTNTLDNEGLGIYFSTNMKIAESYGKYIYTLEINDNYMLDFRNSDVCDWYLGQVIRYIQKKAKINILNYISLKNTSTMLRNGAIAVAGIGREIYLLLDSEERWYNEVSKTSIQRVYSMLKALDKKSMVKAYMFTYHIPSIGVIKDVSPNIVKIVNKEMRN